jgi:DNA-directed RNA polymerase subunit B"
VQFLLIDDIQTSEITTTYDAIKYIGNRVAKGMTEEYRIKEQKDVIDRYLLPHIGVESDTRAEKATYLAEMTEMLLQVIFDEREPHDKDHYATKDSSIRRSHGRPFQSGIHQPNPRHDLPMEKKSG